MSIQAVELTTASRLNRLADHAGSYVAIAVLGILVTIVSVNPKKNRWHRIMYWVLAPLWTVLWTSWAFRSVIGGLGCGSIFFVLLACGYFRYLS